ncbi:MAG: holin [Clostridia bacterium]|nr:holin [Clostridia bacterium]
MDITIILQAVLALLGTIITVVIIPLIRSKTTAEQQATIQNYINIAVYAAEQIMTTPGMGEAKKKYVIDYLASKNITFNIDEIDAAIEAAVKALNIEQGK